MKSLILSLALLLPNFAHSARQINLTTANTVNFRGGVDSDSTARAMLELIDRVKVRGSSNYPIYLVLDSPGGSIEDGQGFIEFVSTLKNIHTISIFSASMAAGIMQALPGKRYITPSAVIMFHRARGAFRGQFEEGEVEQQLQLWKKVVRSMEIVNANRIGISLDQYKSKVTNEWWLYGDDAIKEKVADEVVSIKCSPTLIDKKEIQDVQSMFGSFTVAYSACPLIRVPLPAQGE